MVDCGARRRFATAARGDGREPRQEARAATIVAVFLPHARVGSGTERKRWLLVLDGKGVVLARFDYSPGTSGALTARHWAMDLDGVRRICQAAGLSFEDRHYDATEDMLADHPDWVEPETEFEAVHTEAENVREWSEFVVLAIVLAVLFGGVSLAVVDGTPAARLTGVLAAAAAVVYEVLTLWARSQRRMNRDLARRRWPRRPSGGIGRPHE